ncbi:sigma-70 family RNA polymerase sigma factor [Candidatus Kaiserbacteria bacterium]|nr:sigma-70 family RNA polymerase sigma factor [Candidatus Kaiserbacteria bacterium]
MFRQETIARAQEIVQKELEARSEPKPIALRIRKSAPEQTPRLKEFSREFTSYIPNLRAFAISLTANPDTADDLVQDTLLKAWAASESFDMGTNMRAWLFTILRNTHVSNMRRNRREVNPGDTAYQQMAESLAVPGGQQSNIDMMEFKRALEILPQDQLEALLLVGGAGFSYEQASKIAEVPVGTIKSRVNRARGTLTRELKISGPGDFRNRETL